MSTRSVASTAPTVRLPTNTGEVRRVMLRQPDDVRRLLHDGLRQTRQAVDLLDGADRIILTGVGSSFNAATVGAWMLREIGCDARAIAASDIALYPGNYQLRPTDAVIVLSHYGLRNVVMETLNLARAAGATVLSVGSLTVEHPGSRLILRTVERETSMIPTASHLTAMVVLAQVALGLGERIRRSAVAGWREAIQALPVLITELLAREAEVANIAALAVGRHVYAMASGPNEATACEMMMKARQAGHTSTDAFAFEQLIHGPIVAASAEDMGIVIRAGESSARRSAQFAGVLQRIGMALWIVGEAVPELDHAIHFQLPAVPEVLSPLVALIPVQLLALNLAQLLQPDPETYDRLLPLLP